MTGPGVSDSGPKDFDLCKQVGLELKDIDQ